MLLGRSQDEESMMRRFLQCLQERVESGGCQHMDLVNNEDFVFTDWRRDTHLVDQGTDIVHRVIRGGIQFMDIVVVRDFCPTTLRKVDGRYFLADTI